MRGSYQSASSVRCHIVVGLSKCKQSSAPALLIAGSIVHEYGNELAVDGGYKGDELDALSVFFVLLTHPAALPTVPRCAERVPWRQKDDMEQLS